MSAIDAGVRAPETPWRDEIRAMLQLSWPMILTNLGQTAMTATDVLMMGRLGPDALAAGSLGANLYFMPLIFGLGLMTAASPMIATELGRRRHSVRDVRRTVRQGLWLAVMVSIPIWFLLWQAEPILLAMGQEPRLAAMAGSYVHTLMWASLPFHGYLVLRSFISALERPRWALIIVFSAVAFNAFANWCLMYGNLGFPALGLPGSGVATTISSVMMFAGMAAVVSFERRFRRYRLFGRFWRADWPRSQGVPETGPADRGAAPLRGVDLQCGLLPDGADQRRFDRRLCDRHPDRLALLHDTAGPRPGGDGARRPRAWRRRLRSRHARGLDGLCHGRRLHGAYGDGDGSLPLHADLGLHRPRRAGERSRGAAGGRVSLLSPGSSRSSTARRPSAAACCAACTTRQCR